MSPMSPILLLTKWHISKDYTHYARSPQILRHRQAAGVPLDHHGEDRHADDPPRLAHSLLHLLPPHPPRMVNIYIYLIVRRNCCSFAIRKNCNNATCYVTNEGTQPLRTSGTRTTIPRSAGSSWTTPTPSCPPASPSGCPSWSWSPSTTKYI